jgi:formylglycine-generating enzyme required for sulfatase activity
MSQEITNSEYRAFTDFAAANPAFVLEWKKWDPQTKTYSDKKVVLSEIIIEICVDSLALSKEYEADSDLYKMYLNYFTDPRYNKYPVVGVSFHGAYYYCIWRTVMERKNESSIQDYRIPYDLEWDYAASLMSPSKKTETGKIMPADYYKHGKNSLCNITGNVSEWTSASLNRPGQKIVKGRNWKSSEAPNGIITMDSNSRRGITGFRIVRSYGRFK